MNTTTDITTNTATRRPATGHLTPGADAGGARVARLAADAADAATVRALTTCPDVVALRVERVRGQVDALLWTGTVLALGFTMVNVQQFAAAGSPVFTGGWWVAWLLDPMVSLVLLAVLRAEQVTARYQVALPSWARRTKWLTFAATYVMNTWTSWGLADRPLSWSGVVLHSVAPMVVFAVAETGPGLRDRLTEAVRHAVDEHSTAAVPVGAAALTTPVHDTEHTTVHEPVHDPFTAPVREPLTNPAGTTSGRRDTAARRTGRGTPTSRRLLPEFVEQARAALDTARADGAAVEPTPTWCRRVTGCSTGTSVKVAAALRATPTTPHPAPAPVPADRQAA